jgi:hypothetical protein
MVMRRLSVLIGVAAALIAAAFARRRGAARRERVDLYYDDGSMVSLDARSVESERLLALASQAVSGSAA